MGSVRHSRGFARSWAELSLAKTVPAPARLNAAIDLVPVSSPGLPSWYTARFEPSQNYRPPANCEYTTDQSAESSAETHEKWYSTSCGW